ncbi:helix-turn-helix domain-containing protein [Blautia massiliensis (ex Liu et al. 2021)]|uniref:helix-turn-helix domain-containing protein n=1 Tax=Blautia massiliensis (ex Liu et al. 2021) TaxID=3062492 RepID=UPI003F8A9D8C
MITFGEKLRYLRRKNNLTQKQLGMAVGFSENTADVRIAQYETNARMPKEALINEFARILGVHKEILTVPVLSKPNEYAAAFFWLNEMKIKFQL